ncbi:hypothetical protein QYE76_051932 [Lolium multiflorum]|uniref:Uncharacterized protein n=1 Tax=Lolium multiflorum TaxID=4521 RepID=A0AAD8WKL2_LOLMU|nr:hypothetical protein QYE76_051932 [Lolium multiflorum]
MLAKDRKSLRLQRAKKDSTIALLRAKIVSLEATIKAQEDQLRDLEEEGGHSGRSSLPEYRSGGTPLNPPGRVPALRAVDRGTKAHQQSWEPPGSSCCLVAARRWVLAGNTFGTPVGHSTTTASTSATEMADTPVTYDELTEDHKKNYDMIKSQFEADLIGSFERTRSHGIRWKGFSPEAFSTG